MRGLTNDNYHICLFFFSLMKRFIEFYRRKMINLPLLEIKINELKQGN